MNRYVSKRKAGFPLAVIAALALALLSSCARSGHAVVAAGSTSVLPYAEILAEAYAHLHGGEEIDVQGGGSSAGITAAETGAADIGMSSRALKDSEGHLWSVEIAKDGLAVVVHPSNPVADLTLDEIRAVFTQELADWGQLGGRDAKIHIITREEGSGSRSAFEDLVMDGREISSRAIVQASNGAVRQLVSDDPDAIGFISLGLVEEGEKPVKALRLGGAAATRENVANGAYTLFRPFLFVAREEPTGPAMEFIEFVLSPEGRRVLAAEGLVTEE
ncbi:MAG: phosphate ABC transporter substrate-binding protein [Oscillospiraceae bacterium]|jgi:phosphate transport system substrate-binding protein|nr:phosphate ABC transporter substrate-binding protein [Oscillospiraceae bacterium]